MSRGIDRRAPTAVYRLYDSEGNLLYVGIASHVKRRLYQHATDKTWWLLVATAKVEWFSGRGAAEREEARAIEQEAPRFNARKDPVTGQIRAPRHDYDIEEAQTRLVGQLRAELAAGRYPAGEELDREEISTRHRIPRVVVGFALNELLRKGELLSLQCNRYHAPAA